MHDSLLRWLLRRCFWLQVALNSVRAILRCLLRLVLLRLGALRLLLEELSSFSGILLIKNIFIATHPLSLCNTKFLALLIPAPLVDLGLGQIGLQSDVGQHLLGPVRV